MTLDFDGYKSVCWIEDVKEKPMSQCKMCIKLLRANPREFFKYQGPFGYKVIEKVGKLSYRCSCNRCGHIWLTRSNDAKFQHEEPHKYSERRRQIERIMARMDAKKRDGCTVFVYPKSITPKDFEQ